MGLVAWLVTYEIQILTLAQLEFLAYAQEQSDEGKVHKSY